MRRYIVLFLALTGIAIPVSTVFQPIILKVFATSEYACRLSLRDFEVSVTWIKQSQLAAGKGVTEQFQLWRLPIRIMRNEWLMADSTADWEACTILAHGDVVWLRNMSITLGNTPVLMPKVFAATRVDTPFWFPTAILLALPLALAIYRYTRKFLRKVPGVCRRCGYNLMGNTSGMCPECGYACQQGQGTAQQPSDFQDVNTMNDRSEMKRQPAQPYSIPL